MLPIGPTMDDCHAIKQEAGAGLGTRIYVKIYVIERIHSRWLIRRVTCSGARDPST